MIERTEGMLMLKEPAEKIDRRIKKTKKLLREGLTSLMQTKSIKDITVKELADNIDINRGTFYLYYKDIYDMLDKVETELMEEFNELIMSHPDGALISDPLPLLEEIFGFLSENSDICIALLSNNGDIGFIKKFTHIIHEKCLNDWLQLYNTIDEIEFEYSYSYFLYGCIGIVETWMTTGMQKPPEEMAPLLKNLILNGIFKAPDKTSDITEDDSSLK